MSEDETLLEERFAAWAAACDDALAAGRPAPEFPGGDAPDGLRERVEQTLACMQLMRQVFPGPVPPAALERTLRDDPDAASAATLSGPAPPDTAPDGDGVPEIGRFQVRGPLGSGSFGIVFRAYDPRLNREVALKVPRADVLVNAEFRQRFLREARAAAGLHHPNIVTVYEAGEAGPVCFIASAYCPGGSLAEWLKRRSEPVPARRAAELVAALADAVEHAHGRGVIHRDLKPSNILLQMGNGEGGMGNEKQSTVPSFPIDNSPLPVPMVADLGLARVAAEADHGQTQSGAILGTPGYMAPEQASGRAREVGPAADVYALGAILYELLTGRPPFRGDSVLDTLEQIRTKDPVPPRRLRPRLPRDLETVCLKCLEKDPRKRYGAARELADDLRRFLAGEPVRARPAGRAERLAKWARRRPAVAFLLACLAGVTVAGFSGVVWKWREAEAAVAGLRRNLYFNNVALAERALDANNLRRAERLLDECPPELRHWEWSYLRRLCYGDPHVLRGHADVVFSVAFSPDAALLASAGGDRAIRLWEAASGRPVRTLEGHTRAVYRVVFSPDGRSVASCDEGGTVRVWDAGSGGELWKASVSGGRATHVVAFSPDGQLLVSAGEVDGAVRVWDAATGRPLRTLRGHTSMVHRAAFHPAGRYLATGSWDKTIRIWDAGTGECVRTLEGHTRAVMEVLYSPDGGRLVSASGDEADCGRGEIFVWDIAAGRPVLELRGHTAKVTSLAVTPDGLRLASASRDMTVKVWELETGREVLSLHGFTGYPEAVAFSPDGQRLAAAGWDRLVHLYDAAPRAPSQLHTPALVSPGWGDVAFSPDGRRLAAGGPDYSVRECDPGTGELLRELRGHTWYVTGITYSPDGSKIASCGWDGEPRVWDASNGREVLRLPGQNEWTASVAFDAAGRRLASVSRGGGLRIWDASTGKLLRTLNGSSTAYVYSAAFSPDGRLVAQARDDGKVAFWELPSGRPLRELQAHPDRTTRVAFSPDGRHFATLSSLEGAAKFWKTSDATLVHNFRGATGMSLAFSPDGRRLAVPVADDRVRIWDVETGDTILTLFGPTGEIRSVAYSPDGRRVAALSYTLTVHVWELPQS